MAYWFWFSHLFRHISKYICLSSYINQWIDMHVYSCIFIYRYTVCIYVDILMYTYRYTYVGNHQLEPRSDQLRWGTDPQIRSCTRPCYCWLLVLMIQYQSWLWVVYCWVVGSLLVGYCWLLIGYCWWLVIFMSYDCWYPLPWPYPHGDHLSGSRWSFVIFCLPSPAISQLLLVIVSIFLQNP